MIETTDGFFFARSAKKKEKIGEIGEIGEIGDRGRNFAKKVNPTRDDTNFTLKTGFFRFSAQVNRIRNPFFRKKTPRFIAAILLRVFFILGIIQDILILVHA